MTINENSGARIISWQAVPITASGLNGEQPLVDRRM
jgi:hypothetical protein